MDNAYPFLMMIKRGLTKELFFILLLGFSSGLPFLLTLSTLSFWLTENGVTKATIGLFMFVTIPYSLKFLWAPFMDHYRIPWLSKQLGQYRSWALVMQAGLVLSLVGLSFSNPGQTIIWTAFWAFFVSFFAASQDIVIDAYRIVSLSPSQQGLGAACETVGFRLGMLASGAGALYLAAIYDWQWAYQIMAMGVGVGILTIFVLAEPKTKVVAFHGSRRGWPHRAMFLQPWKKLFKQEQIWVLLAFIFCFKMADTVLNAMSAPFLNELGFSKIEFAHISKVFGIALMVIGGLSGGLLMSYLGTLQTLVTAALLQTVSCLMFVIQSLVGYHLGVLMITVGFESFCSGLTSAVFIAYLSSFCSQPYTAAHFTLLYSFGSLARVLISAIAGWFADWFGWAPLFMLTALSIIPILKLLSMLQAKELPSMKWEKKKKVSFG